jgi:hypothetical protein
MICPCCSARLPSDERADFHCDVCLSAGCDVTLDSVQCRPDAELEAGPRIVLTSEEEEDYAERTELEQNKRRTVGPLATFARDHDEDR